MDDQLDLFNESLELWDEEIKSNNTREADFDTLSGLKQEPCYFPEHPDNNYIDNLGFPGQFPFTRGIHSNLYRGRLWTMRQFAGFGTPEETNERFKNLLKKGQTGLSVAYDMPTLMGYDPDHSFSQGEVGKCGVSVFSLSEMEKLFQGINLGEISVSQTINGPAIILLAFYIAIAEQKGVDQSKLKGTLQNDILKELTNSSKANVNIAKIIPARCTEKYPIIPARMNPATPPNRGKIGRGIYKVPLLICNKIKPEKWIENYFVQEMFYAAAYYEMTGIPVKKLITLMVTPGGEVKVFDKRNKGDYIKMLVRYIKEFVHHNIGSDGE